MNISTSQYAAIFTKSNRGEKLDETEALILNRLLFSINGSARLEMDMRQDIGHSGAVPLVFVAIFLHENPGVRGFWLAQADQELRDMEQLGTTRSSYINFRDAVVDNLAQLDSAAK